jgi:DNA-directed RNA polymerase specialized sigma24 family protein
VGLKENEMTDLERKFHARQFLSTQLTSRERMLVASYALGYSPAEAAKAWGISAAAVSKMNRRIKNKAAKYWQQ